LGFDPISPWNRGLAVPVAVKTLCGRRATLVSALHPLFRGRGSVCFLLWL
jgi:hypothetical protein